MEGREGLKREDETLTTRSIHKHTHVCIMTYMHTHKHTVPLHSDVSGQSQAHDNYVV